MKKAWKDAASLMLATGPFRYSRPPLPARLALSTGGRLAGSSLPAVLEDTQDGRGGGGGGEGEGGMDTQLLFVKRTSSSGFMVRGRGTQTHRDFL